MSLMLCCVTLDGLVTGQILKRVTLDVWWKRKREGRRNKVLVFELLHHTNNIQIYIYIYSASIVTLKKWLKEKHTCPS